ncbi:CD83 antigen [Odontesthes bonariensis]|uniref:uncharacterized protein LOC142380340 n=1 Tax=Odontesthes bonariensis TaxID=219752 RepID=UPI003F58AEFB
MRLSTFLINMTMIPDVLSLALLLPLYVCLVGGRVVSDARQVKALSGWNCTLKCTAEYKPGVQYSAVSWYKLGGNPSHPRSGLLRKELPNGMISWYAGLDREVELVDDSHNIFLPNLTCRDGGVYLCKLSAPVGERNREGRVLLTLTDCPAGPTESPEEFKDDLVGPTDFPIVPAQDPMTNDLVICAMALIMVALVILSIIHCCFNSTFKEKKKTTKKEILLDAPAKELKKKDLMLIYTLGPKPSTMKHVCV